MGVKTTIGQCHTGDYVRYTRSPACTVVRRIAGFGKTHEWCALECPRSARFRGYLGEEAMVEKLDDAEMALIVLAGGG